MKYFVVILGVLALLAFTQAQSGENENTTDPSSDEDGSGSSENRIQPPEHPEHPGKPDHPRHPEHHPHHPGHPGRPGHAGHPEHPEHPLRPGHHGPPGHRPNHEPKPEPEPEQGRKILPGVSVGPNGWSFRAPGIAIDIARPKIFQQKPKQESQPKPAESEEEQSLIKRFLPRWG